MLWVEMLPKFIEHFYKAHVTNEEFGISQKNKVQKKEINEMGVG